MHLVVVFFNLVQERRSLCGQNQILRKTNTSVKKRSPALEIKIEQGDKRTASRKLLTSASTQANAPKRTSAAASRVSMKKELEPRRRIKRRGCKKTHMRRA